MAELDSLTGSASILSAIDPQDSHIFYPRLRQETFALHNADPEKIAIPLKMKQLSLWGHSP
jgi:hypothetical protein